MHTVALGKSRALVAVLIVAGILFVDSVITPNTAQSNPVTTPLAGITRSSGSVAETGTLPKGASTDRKSVALRFIQSHQDLLGVSDKDVQLDRVVDTPAGTSTLRFAQVVDGARVEGSLVAITVSAKNDVLSFSAVTITLDSRFVAIPTLSAAAAQSITQDLLAQSAQVDRTLVEVSEPRLSIVDSRLVPGAAVGDILAWKSMTMVNSAPLSSAWTLISDSGRALIATDSIVHGITYQPNVCDLQLASADDYAGQNRTSGTTLVQRITLKKTGESHNYIDTTAGIYPLCGTKYVGANGASAASALANIGTTWDFYKNVIGIDINEEVWLGNIASSINGDKNPRISAFINTCFTDKVSDCPDYANAVWAPWSSKICRSYACSGIFMGAQFDQALDVIAHELTHGVTFSVAFTDFMSDTSEAAALSEGLSDVFGESVERLSPTSQPDPTWQIGESVKSGSGAGPYRVMQTGTSYQFDGSSVSVPAITSSWTPDDSHNNNGPINRLAWLLANGTNVGSPTVQPLGTVPADGVCHELAQCTGITRMDMLMYTAMSHVTSTSSYFDFGRALLNACISLTKAKADGFSAANCLNVKSALTLTGITKLVLKNRTLPLKYVRPKSAVVSAQLQSLTGAQLQYIPMKIERRVGSKWVTYAKADSACRRYCTNISGAVRFTVKWPTVTKYRISTAEPNGPVSLVSSIYTL